MEPVIFSAVPLLVVMTATGLSHVGLRRITPVFDPFVLPILTCLAGLGFVMLQRLAPNFLSRQLLWFVLGMVFLVIVVVVPRDLRWLRQYRYLWLLSGFLLLALTFILGVNPLGRGARLWLGLAGAYFQPSEFLKLVFVVFLASYLAEKQELIRVSFSQVGRFRLPSLPYLVPLVLVWTIAVLLLVAQQDMGAGTLLFCTFLVMLYVCNQRISYILGSLILFAFTAIISYRLSAFVALRFDVWLDPWSQSESGGYQIIQTLISFAAGGILGTGIGHGYGAEYIPVVHTDFVFAAIGEELGLTGALALIIIYVLFMYRGLRIALRADSTFNRLLAIGLTMNLVIQAWVIMAGNLKVLPLTGVTLPFVSYGGSSLVTGCLAMGLLLHISANATGNISQKSDVFRGQEQVFSWTNSDE